MREIAAPRRPASSSAERLRALTDLVVTRDTRGVALVLVAKLNRAGVRARVADAAGVDAMTTADGLLVLDGLNAFADRAAAIETNRRAFLAAKAVAGRLSRGGGVFVTVQDTGGNFGLSASPRCWSGGLSGLAKTARLEWPDSLSRAIDLECGDRSPDLLAEALFQELLEGGAEAEIGLRHNGSRVTVTMIKEDLAASGSELIPMRAVSTGAAELVPVNAASVLLATGGARGVTAHCLVALARKTHPRAIILCGRTKLETEPPACRGVEGDAQLKQALLASAQASGKTFSPKELAAEVDRVLRAREVHANIAALRASGAEVEYLCVDVCDAAALRAALEPLRRKWGPITGLVHGAGVLADKLIADKTPEQFDSVFRTKVAGFEALLDVTAYDPLTLITVFSSVAARAGNTGQSDYAMANEVLNKVADYEAASRGSRCLVKSLNWGPLEGGMVTPALARHFRELGVEMIPLDAGADAFVGEIRRGRRQDIEIVIGSTSIHDV